MRQGLPFSCRCGALTGRVAPAGPGHGSRLLCYCKDCRAAAIHLGAGGLVRTSGGVDLYQTRPDRVRLISGTEHLACLRLSPKGMLRWYASCCNTPLANTMPTRNPPFVSLSCAVVKDAGVLGPVVAHLNTASAKAGTGAPTRDTGMARMVLALLGRALGAYLSGNSKVSPFFTSKGAPIVTPHVISLEDRRRASA